MLLGTELEIPRRGLLAPPAVNFGNHGNPESQEILQLYCFSKSCRMNLRTDSSQNPPHSAMRSVWPPASKGWPSQSTSLDQAWLILNSGAAAAAVAPASTLRRLSFVSFLSFIAIRPTP